MKQFLLLTLLWALPVLAFAQQIITIDPDKDTLARRRPDGALQLIVPVKVLAVSIQETLPNLGLIQSVEIQKIGKSHYLLASYAGDYGGNPPGKVAILLVESASGAFQADQLILSCNGSSECRECNTPPLCSCNKGDGSCSLSSTVIAPLKKVTVSIFD